MSKPKGDNGLLGRLGYLSYVRGLAPELWFRFNEAAGAALNRGSLGSGFNGTYSNCLLAQTGKVGAADAVQFDGMTSVLSVPAGAHGNWPAHTIAVLQKSNTAGESNNGQFGIWGAGIIQMQWGGSMNVVYTYRGMTGNASFGGTLNVSTAWNWIFYTFDANGDKKPYLYKGVGGALVTATGVQTAGSGSLTNGSGQILYIGNNAGGTHTLDGLLDEWLMWDRVLSAAEMLQIARLTGV